MAATPFLSVVITTYNDIHRLPTTVVAISASLVQQSFPTVFIVVDDGNADGTAGLAHGATCGATCCMSGLTIGGKLIRLRCCNRQTPASAATLGIVKLCATR